MAAEIVAGQTTDQVHKKNTGKNGIRRLAPVYSLPMDLVCELWFPGHTASDLTRLGVELVRDGSDMVLGQTEPVSRSRRSKSRGVIAWGFFMDGFDGNRARRRREVSREGALLDLAADRTQEGDLGLKILLHNWKAHMDKHSETSRQELLDLLMIPTATILPTLAAAQGRMLGIVIPEKSPTGGSRFDRVMKLNRAYNASTNGNYERSNKLLRQMLRNVKGAYEFRSEQTIDYRTDKSKPNTFDTDQFSVDNPVFRDHKSHRDELETWIHFVWFLNKTVDLVTHRLHQAGIDQSLITAYQAAVKEQMGGYKKDVTELTALRDKWRKAYPDEFTYALSPDLTPQALLGVKENQIHEPITVYES